MKNNDFERRSRWGEPAGSGRERTSIVFINDLERSGSQKTMTSQSRDPKARILETSPEGAFDTQDDDQPILIH